MANDLKINENCRAPAPTPAAGAPVIDSVRLRALMDGVNAFGRNPETGGFNRPGFSNADIAAREWFEAQMKADGLHTARDGAANVFGRYGPAEGPAVMTGSHLDTVPEGGAYDGVLGACAALECVRAMQDAGYVPDIAVEVIATSEEEGRFGGMLGSQTVAGLVTREWIDGARSADGLALTEAMKAQGLDPYGPLQSARAPETAACFVELHIEQGPVLENEGALIGAATAISGVCNLRLIFTGAANHSGTTPMHLRADAFKGMVRFAAGVDDIIAGHGSPEARITVGKADIKPNFPHTIPGAAECIVNIRDTELHALRAMKDAVTEAARAAAAACGLEVRISEQSWLAPVTLDPGIVKIICEEAEAIGCKNIAMPSGAGHDTQNMQTICPSGLIFVPSIGGVSHSEKEETRWEDIEKGAQVLLNTLMRLSRRCGGQ